MPWLAVNERLKKGHGPRRYDCKTCKAAYDYHTRAGLKCGYVRREDWTAPMEKWGYLGGSPILDPETCPGYTTTLGAVLEVAEAWGWWDKGQLGMLSEVPETLAHLVSIFNEQMLASRAYFMDKSSSK